MKIKDVENQLSISRANIRFYEKEGLLSPKRSNNNYRDYTEEDIETLKKIIVFRKLGFTIEEISKMQKGEINLDSAIDDNIKRLKIEIENLKGSLEVTKLIKNDKTDFENINEEYYWYLIRTEERKGKQFVDICKDYIMFEIDRFETGLKWVFFFDFKKLRKKRGTKVACVILILWCVGRGVSNVIFRDGDILSFLYGMLYPFIVFLRGLVITLPLYILARKAPKVANVFTSIISIFIFLFFLAIA